MGLKGGGAAGGGGEESWSMRGAGGNQRHGVGEGRVLEEGGGVGG